MSVIVRALASSIVFPVQSYDVKSKECDLLNLYLADHEQFDKTPIRAQWTDEKNAEIWDGAWYRQDSASAGYVVIRWFDLTGSNQRGPVHGVTIKSYLDLQDDARRMIGGYGYLLGRLQALRYRINRKAA